MRLGCWADNQLASDLVATAGWGELLSNDLLALFGPYTKLHLLQLLPALGIYFFICPILRQLNSQYNFGWFQKKKYDSIFLPL